MTKNTTYRTESDSLGEINIPNQHYYGAQTQRSLHNFPIGDEQMPAAVIMAIVQIKKAAAQTHNQLGLLPKESCEAIINACDEIIAGHWPNEFPLSVWQSGSGTQSHMNVNEVVANRANELLGQDKGSHQPIHPNDTVNKSQSTNDVFSSAVQLAAHQELNALLLPALQALTTTLADKQKEFSDIIIVGRTHMGDAVPIYLRQRFSGYAAQINACTHNLQLACNPLCAIPIGGTAIGTGANAPQQYKQVIIEKLTANLNITVAPCDNTFAQQASLDTLVNTSAHLNTLACAVIKLANDIRLMSSGPRCGFGEITLPINEPGSSIMPGKINPTQCESLIMVATRVQGNHVTITNANSLISFDAHSFRPVIIYSLLQSIRLLSDSINSFTQRCLVGISANQAKLQYNLEHSYTLATALTPKIGYEKACKVAKKALADDSSLKAAAIALGYLSDEECDQLLNPKQLL